MRKLMLAGAAVAALAAPGVASAAPYIEINYTTVTPGLPGLNNFNSQLGSLGITRLAYGEGTQLLLSGPARITFEFLGSESGYSDTFISLLSGALSRKETGTFENHFLAPLPIGTQVYGSSGPLDLAGILKFQANNRLTDAFIGSATVGDPGFGVYLTGGLTSGSRVKSLLLGYDDQLTNPDDDDWDDFVVRATISAVPEPSTWAVMILGIGFVGAAMRRRQQAVPSYA